MNTASVGICAHNEEETIGQLLDQIMAEDVPIRQIIVVVAGEDRTEEKVEGKKDSDPDVEIEIVREESRRGQSAAQNEILERATENSLFLIDGDGTIEPGSLELMWKEYDGESIIYGRELPDTPDNLTGKIIDHFWKLHHELSLRQPKYTTQLALQPSSLIDHIPKEIVIDDEYIGRKAVDAGYDIVYVPDAVKNHNIKGDLKSFIRHRRKNWAGMLQMQDLGYDNLQSTGLKARFYMKNLLSNGPRKSFYFTLLGFIEFTAFLGALKDAAENNWPYKWKR